MTNLCALLKRTCLARACAECGEDRCACPRVVALEDRQRALNAVLAYETDLAFAEARAAYWAIRRDRG